MEAHAAVPDGDGIEWVYQKMRLVEEHEAQAGAENGGEEAVEDEVRGLCFIIFFDFCEPVIRYAQAKEVHDGVPADAEGFCELDEEGGDGEIQKEKGKIQRGVIAYSLGFWLSIFTKRPRLGEAFFWFRTPFSIELRTDESAKVVGSANGAPIWRLEPAEGY